MANNLADKFEEMADAVPDRTALIGAYERLTFAELDARANQFARHLAANHVRRDSVVGLVGRNSIPWVVALLACFKLRAIAVNVNYRYVAAELSELFADSAAVALVVDGDLVAECAAAIGNAFEPHHVVVIGEDVGQLGGRAVTYQEALNGWQATRDFDPRSGDDLHMLYTGGTTGRPKGVVWRHEDTYFLTTGGMGSDPAKAATTAPVVQLPAGPFMHSSPQWVLIGGLINGRTTVVLDRFNARRVWQLCDRESVSMLAITGDAMARPLLEELTPGEKTPESIRVVSSSGGALSPVTKAELARVLPHAVIADSLGSTETGLIGTSAAIAQVGDRPELQLPATAGTIVVDAEGQLAAVGAEGMLAKAGFLPLRYHNDPEKTARTFVTFSGVRYAIPGDVARREADGTITVLGRQSSCINTGGEKVYPNEVESVLKTLPAVHDCLVVGRPDATWGQQVCVILQERHGHAVTLDELQTFARGKLASYKLPRALCRVDYVQRQPSGKPDLNWVTSILDEPQTQWE